MGKTRIHFKKTESIKGTFHVRMGMKKERNCKDLTEAEEIRTGDTNTQNYTKKRS